MSIILNQQTEVEMKPLCDDGTDEIIETEKVEIIEDTKKDEKEEIKSVQNNDIVEEPTTTTGIQISYGKYHDININLIDHLIFLILSGILSILDEAPASNIQPLLTLEEIYKSKPRNIRLSLKEMNNNRKKKEDTGNMSLKSYFFQVIVYLKPWCTCHYIAIESMLI